MVYHATVHTNSIPDSFLILNQSIPPRWGLKNCPVRICSLAAYGLDLGARSRAKGPFCPQLKQAPNAALAEGAAATGAAGTFVRRR